MTEKRFNDEEVSLILRRSLEGDARGEAGGLTLRQLKEIAAEVGIDPARVESAALAVQAEGGVRKQRGLRTTSRYDVLAEGRIPPEQRAEVLRRIRAVMGRHGIVNAEGDTLEWKARDFFGGRYVTVRPEGDGTRVEALGNFREGAMAGTGLFGTLGLATTAVALKAIGGVAALGVAGPAVLFAGAALPAWVVYRRLFRKEDAALRQVVADISAQAAEEARLADEEDGPDAHMLAEGRVAQPGDPATANPGGDGPERDGPESDGP